MFNIFAPYGKKSNWISGCQGYMYIMLSGITAKNNKKTFQGNQGNFDSGWILNDSKECFVRHNQGIA